MDDLIRDFLTETTESMGQVDNDLVALEQRPDDADLIGRIFRMVHTVKGTCGFLGLSRLEKVAHAGENVLGRFRDGSLSPTEDRIGLVLAAMDCIKTIVTGIEQTDGTEPPGDDSALIARLDALYRSDAATSPAEAPPSASEPTETDAIQAPETEIVAEQAPAASAEDVSTPAEAQPADAAAKPVADAPAASQVAGQSIRVSLDLLEGLMTTVSELVLTRNQLLQSLRAQENPTVHVPLQRLSQITSELQEGIMRTRMQPIGNAWSKLPRLVRDLAVELGKKIDLQMTGAETELDRQVLELIRDPLTHMVRNSADHGLETGGERVAAGKSETGTIRLNAYHKGGHIIIEISDDGRGLPVEKIKRKAIQARLVTESEAAQLSAQQIQSLIFRAGFSTAEKVTAVSGRGVGMDVVRTNIDRIGGSIELESREGGGTTFYIKIPLTLAIVSALIVEAAGQKFAIPQIAVSELVLARPEQIEEVGGAPVFRLRDRLLPLVKLADVLGVAQPGDAPRSGLIMVAQVGRQTFGVVVDRVHDTEEIVVKPVSQILRNLTVYAGNTILGDGSVIMILDPNGMANMIGRVDADGSAHAAKSVQAAQSTDAVQLILFEASASTAPRAVLLDRVARLENLDAGRVEIVDGCHVVQYRGELMPLLTVEPSGTIGREGPLSVLVFSDRGRSLGLVVERILDIVEAPLDLKLASTRPGSMGTAVIAGRATEIIDVNYFVQRGFRADNVIDLQIAA